MSECYYFGCVGEPGHFLYDSSLRSVGGGSITGWPWRRGGLDCEYAPGGSDGPQKLGVTALAHHEGWTVLAMWDRSVDKRGNSNAAFIARGEHDEGAMREIAAAAFPAVWARIGLGFDAEVKR